MGWEVLLMGAYSMHNGQVPFLAIRWCCYFVWSDVLAFRGCLASLTFTQSSWMATLSEIPSGSTRLADIKASIACKASVKDILSILISF